MPSCRVAGLVRERADVRLHLETLVHGNVEGAPHRRRARGASTGSEYPVISAANARPASIGVPRDDAVDETHRESLVRLHHAPGHHDVERVRLADEARQALRPAVARYEPELDLGEPHAGGRGREAEGAGHRELEAAPEGEPVDDRDRRNAEIGYALEEGLSEPEPPAVLEWGATHELLHVRAGAERPPARSGHEERPHLAVRDVLLDLGHPRFDLAQHREAEGVEDARAVEGEDVDAVTAPELDRHAGFLGGEAGHRS